MSSDSVQSSCYAITGSSVEQLVRSVEDGVFSGALEPGDKLPSVRRLARDLELSPTTVATAYRELRHRGVIITQDRSRTLVAHHPPLRFRLDPHLPADAVDLASGNPDPALLPSLRPALTSVPDTPSRYTDAVMLDELADLARQAFVAEGVPAEHLVVVGGALDGIERVLEVHLRVGDRVAVEDPGYPGTWDLVRALGLEPVPITVDDDGPDPEALAAALDAGIDALLVTPRAQNPTGAAIGAERAEVLRRLLDDAPATLVIEDDHAAPIAGVALHSLTTGRSRFAQVRSVAKWLGPQLRVGVLAADESTATRVLARQRLGVGWVSQVLQHLVVATWRQARDDGTLTHAAMVYGHRRQRLRAALEERGITSRARSGINVWIPVAEEVPVVQSLADAGWAVAAGEAFRMHAPPGVRITLSGATDAAFIELADALRAALDDRLPGRRG